MQITGNENSGHADDVVYPQHRLFQMVEHKSRLKMTERGYRVAKTRQHVETVLVINDIKIRICCFRAARQFDC